MKWIDVSLPIGGEVKMIYTAAEADELIAAGILTPETTVTALYSDGAIAVAARTLPQFGFQSQDDEAEDDQFDDEQVLASSVEASVEMVGAESESIEASRTDIIAQLQQRADALPTAAMDSGRLPAVRRPLGVVANPSNPFGELRQFAEATAQNGVAAHWFVRAFHRASDFEGRANQAEYWGFVAAYFVAAIALSIVAIGLFGVNSTFSATLLLLLIIALSFVHIGVSIRRLHDIDISGWALLGFLIASVVPGINILTAIGWIVITLLPGTQGGNKYGAPPPR